MVTADVLAVVFTLTGLCLAVPAFQLVARAMWPRQAEQAARRFAETPGRTLTAGLFLASPVFLPPLALMGVDVPPVRMLGVWWLGLIVGLALAGLGGLATRVGATLRSPHDDTRPWLGLVKGSLALQFACMVPILGWFLLFPLLLIAGWGASVLALIRPLKDRQVQPLRAHAGS